MAGKRAWLAINLIIPGGLVATSYGASVDADRSGLYRTRSRQRQWQGKWLVWRSRMIPPIKNGADFKPEKLASAITFHVRFNASSSRQRPE